MRYYYNPTIGADLSKGYDTFVKADESGDEHLVSLLKTIQAHEQKSGQKIDAQLVTWRGMMTKVRLKLLCRSFVVLLNILFLMNQPLDHEHAV